jgi:hypothetical protein
MKKFFSHSLVFGIIGFMVVVPMFSARAISVTVDTTSKTEAAAKDDSGVSAEQAKETATGAWEKIKHWGISVYEKIDAWRIHQYDTWVAIKNEKRQQIKDQTNALDEHRDERVDKVLNEQQTSLVQGSGDEFKGSGHVFLLKLYAGVLAVLTFIFSSRLVFYAILIFLVLTILSKLINMFRGRPSGF